MTLEEDVHDANGWLLLTAGCELTATHIRNLRAREVTQVSIQGLTQDQVDEKKLSELAPEHQARVHQESEKLFRHADRSDPFIEELFRLTLVRKAAEIADAD